ncbi:LysR family transcriptional regulator [Altericroceibacterium spongiae]|uniref:LysR family transcriptional regulator n=1 Tax=Altericroceibacterium spongiae TaxID=2320269 RepID=A0A420EP44_9SPHN|nr:LysR substrate-binding domain-containing protein [Altericroceibacterium spongiae]RKF22449.1 LysR family transcriptional regulator [Altericroceibacterium spongiae]
MSDRPHLPPFAALKAFEAFGRYGGVRRTASALGVSHAIVSRHLRTLEEWLGIMLVDRARGELTPAGLAYHAQIGSAFDQLCSATESARGRKDGRLDLWCAPGFAYLWLTARLPQFSQTYRGSTVDLRPSDSPPDLNRREAHADIRWWRKDMAEPDNPPAGVRRELIVSPRVFPVARPDASWLTGQLVEHPKDLRDLPLAFEDNDLEWRGWFDAQQGCSISLPEPTARLWQAHMTLSFALEGHGIALTNFFLAGDYLAKGQLIEIGGSLPDFHPAYLGGYYLSAREELWDLWPLKHFRQWLTECLTSRSNMR